MSKVNRVTNSTQREPNFAEIWKEEREPQQAAAHLSGLE
jgi:hypothetical protein